MRVLPTRKGLAVNASGVDIHSIVNKSSSVTTMISPCATVRRVAPLAKSTRLKAAISRQPVRHTSQLSVGLDVVGRLVGVFVGNAVGKGAVGRLVGRLVSRLVGKIVGKIVGTAVGSPGGFVFMSADGNVVAAGEVVGTSSNAPWVGAAVGVLTASIVKLTDFISLASPVLLAPQKA
jgi:hypothetical protein